MTTHQNDLTYRPDVDGLRAIAVGIVVLFHARLGIFPGGYTGVDVFFVISGFLISSILWRELQAGGTFSITEYILKFYERRIRRIFPALAVILLVTLALGALLFAPQDYFLLGRSARATAAFFSNFYFNNQSGYFAPGAETQPLLHTWSLAVEEQFYFVGPFFLMLLAWLSSRYRILLFLGVFAASLAISSIGAWEESKAAFYLPYGRAFELMMGMALVIGLAPRWPNDAMREVAAFAGVAMILAAALLYSDATPFPGVAALLPCVGTYLLISTAVERTTLVSRALSIAPVVMIGKISYSLYLWHWPLFVFAEYEYGERLPLAYRIGLIALAVGLSFLTYWFVEQPARRRTPAISRRAVIWSGLAVMAVVAALSQGVVETRGWPQRLAPELVAFEQAAARSKVRPVCQDPNEDSASAPGCAIGSTSAPTTTFLFWGDSHAVSLSQQMAVVAQSLGVRGAAAVVGGCPPLLMEEAKDPIYLRKPKCREVSNRVTSLLLRKEISLVVIAARWPYYTEGNLDEGPETNRFNTGSVEKNRTVFYASVRGTIERILASGHKVALIGPIPELKMHLPNAMMKAMMRGQPQDFSLPFASFAKRQVETFKLLAELDALPGVRVVYPHKVLCDATTCRTTADGMPLYFDDDHLGAFGTKAIESVLADALDTHAAFDAPSQ